MLAQVLQAARARYVPPPKLKSAEPGLVVLNVLVSVPPLRLYVPCPPLMPSCSPWLLACSSTVPPFCVNTPVLPAPFQPRYMP